MRAIANIHGMNNPLKPPTPNAFATVDVERLIRTTL